MSILRIYDTDECDEAGGVPLSWARCQLCRGGKVVPEDDDSTLRAVKPCPACEGHGSLRAAVLAELTTPSFTIDTYGPTYEMVDGEMRQTAPARKADPPDPTVRCAGCGHPMSVGTWEASDVGRASDFLPAILRHAVTALRNGSDPSFNGWWNATHWSPCDDGCRHGTGDGGEAVRWRFEGGEWQTHEGLCGADPEWLADVRRSYDEMQVSWRAVDVRTLGWAHDLRPERLAVLCLRCWAGRTS
jgi:hypothetical protein